MTIAVGQRSSSSAMIVDILKIRMAMKWGRVNSGCGHAMSIEMSGDILFINYFYLRTLFMNYCVIQHVKLPFVAYEEARHRKVTGLRITCIMQAFVH